MPNAPAPETGQFYNVVKQCTLTLEVGDCMLLTDHQAATLNDPTPDDPCIVLAQDPTDAPVGSVGQEDAS